MKRINIEKVKTFFLVILIITTLTLTGSLWFEDYHGLSDVINNLPIWFNTAFNEETPMNLQETVIMPYKITMTNGDNGKWSHYAFSEANKEGLALIVKLINKLDKSSKIENAGISEWEDIINRKSVICYFDSPIDILVFKVLLNSGNYLGDNISSIKEIGVTKTLSGGLIYIRENDNSVRRIQIGELISEVETYIQKYSNMQTYAKLITLKEMGTETFYGDKKVEPNYDILFPITNKQSGRKKVSKIEFQGFFSDADTSYLEKIASDIFNNSDFTKFLTSDKGYIFINDDGSSIKMESDGTFEYIGKPGTANDEDINYTTSFEKALEFAHEICKDGNLYLAGTSYNKEDDKYNFLFGNATNSIILADTQKRICGNSRVLLSIDVKNNNVINSKAVLKRFTTKELNTYITNFGPKILDNVLASIDNKKKVKINALDLIYDIAEEREMPVWYTEYSANEKQESVVTVSARERAY